MVGSIKYQIVWLSKVFCLPLQHFPIHKLQSSQKKKKKMTTKDTQNRPCLLTNSDKRVGEGFTYKNQNSECQWLGNHIKEFPKLNHPGSSLPTIAGVGLGNLMSPPNYLT